MTGHLSAVTLDANILRYHNIEIRYERETAIRDLLEANQFQPESLPPGSFALHLTSQDDRLLMEITADADGAQASIPISLLSFRRVMKDYFLIWESYGAAMRGATAEQLEAIDMGRRALHDEGAALLLRQLQGKVALDHATARRLFTLLCVLQIR